MTNNKQMAIHDCGTGEITYRDLTDEEITATELSQAENNAIITRREEAVSSVANWVLTHDSIDTNVKNAIGLLLGVNNATEG